MKWDTLRFVGLNNVDLPVLGMDPSGPFILKGVEGLDPPPVDVKFIRVRGQRAVRQPKEPQPRQIVALVGLQPDWNTGQSSSDLRETLYGLLTPKYGEMMKACVLLDGVVIAEAQGDVSNIDASIFAKDPEVQVTLDCDYAYLTGPSDVYQTPARSEDGGTTSITIENDGTAPAGFSMQIVFATAHSGTLQILEQSAFGARMNIEGPFAAGEKLLVNTIPGSRTVQLTPAGSNVGTSILNRMSGDWLMLHGGDNVLRINNIGFTWGLGPFRHRPAYWGV